MNESRRIGEHDPNKYPESVVVVNRPLCHEDLESLGVYDVLRERGVSKDIRDKLAEAARGRQKAEVVA